MSDGNEYDAGVARKHPGGRPPLPPGEVRQQIGIRLHPATIVALDRLAELLECDRTEVVERLVWYRPLLETAKQLKR